MSELPKSQRAEEAVIAAVLRNPDIAPEVMAVLPDAGTFYFRPYRMIYDRLVESHYADEPMDPLWIAETLGTQLATAWKLDEKEIADRCMYLAKTSTVDGRGAVDAAKLVKRHADYRALAILADEARQMVDREEEDPSAIASRMSTQAMKIATDRAHEIETFSYRELGRRWVKRMKEQMLARKLGVELGAYFSLSFLDDYLKGLRPTELFIVGGEPGSGKALALDTPLPTPTGWTTMGEVEVGDELLDEAGQPCRVLITSPIQHGRSVYDVVFSDGSVIRADAEHLWVTTDRRSRISSWRVSDRRQRGLPRGVSRNPSGGRYTASVGASDKSRLHYAGSYDTVEEASAAAVQKRSELGIKEFSFDCRRPVTTEEIRKSIKLKDGRANHAVAVCEALELPDAQLPIPPYVLGAWLGDGSTNAGRITSVDVEILDRIREEGYVVRATKDPITWGVLGLLADLRTDALLGDKHVPSAYLRGSIRQRRELLAGLMDTDGTVMNGGSSCQFDTTCPALRDGTYELIVSLGYRATVREGRSRLDGRDCGPKWTVNFAPYDQSPFYLPRKTERWRAATDRVKSRYIVEVRPVPTEPVKCVKVSSESHLYLAGKSMIPTHNTAIAQIAAENFARKQMKKPPDKRIATLFLSMEMGEEPSSTRLAQSVGHIEGDRLREGTINEQEMVSVAQNWARQQDLPLHYNHASLLRESQMRALISEEVRKHNVGLVIIDHFRMIEPDNPNLNRNESDDQIVKFLKMSLAKDLNLAVICLAHTIKQVERMDKRPRLSDLRGSGAISAFADFVGFVYRPWTYATDEEREMQDMKQTDAELIYAKSRHSAQGTGFLHLNISKMEIRERSL